MADSKRKTKSEIPSIESTMKSIEKLLETLENSETPLDQSLLAFEEGIHLIRSAQKTLSEAEQKVRLLSRRTVNRRSRSLISARTRSDHHLFRLPGPLPGQATRCS
ncbi:MAG: exodeoxyribonuclease VII small subunit [Halioglobus sp.]